MSRADGSKSTVERAIEIARDGKATSMTDIREQLSAEQYEGVHTATGGLSIRDQLRKLIDARLRRASDV